MGLSPGFTVLIILPAFLLHTSGLYIASSVNSLQHILGEYGLVRPISVDAEGRFLSHAVSAGWVAEGQSRRRRKREIEWHDDSDSIRYFEPLHDECLYVGDITDIPGATVAISNCDGLAGMIRTEQEEFFIEPVERGNGVIEKEEEAGGGRTHIIYRSSAVKKVPNSSTTSDHHSKGVQFRTRSCDNPSPANGGRTCIGATQQFQMCNTNECKDIYSDPREEKCHALDHSNKHHWMPYEDPDPKKRCHLYCQFKETRKVILVEEVVLDGTRCSYKDPHSVCVRGSCEKAGCDKVIGSSKQEDECGVCGGDNSSCKTSNGTITLTAEKQGFLKVLGIPRGARHLLIQELKATPHTLAVINVASGQFFLNAGDEYPETHSVIEKGIKWEYENDNEKETLQSAGPLRHEILIMMKLHGDEDVHLSYKYVMNRNDFAIQNNKLVEDSAYEWAYERLSDCSKTCGGGKQYPRYGCRRKVDHLMVSKKFCKKYNTKPRGGTQYCNQKPCPPPIWVSGEWQNCSMPCGKTGSQVRSVSCVQPLEDNTTRLIHNKYCSDDRPESRRQCNRFPCSTQWRVGPWSQCSVTCGNGTQQRQALCRTRNNTIGLCLDSKPETIRVCRLEPCPKGPSDPNKNGNILIQWLSRPDPNYPRISSRKTSLYSSQPGLHSSSRSCLSVLCWALPFSVLLSLQGRPRLAP
uniref:ADAM metallopeptidase with thrombospondin type 1 motif, 2 n=1 Tax=Nothobranchius pienaari TaxID=704102 RepID=A0A1A8QCH2_9TELE